MPANRPLVSTSVFLIFLLLSTSSAQGQFKETYEPPGYLLQWGSNGAGDGQFDSPYDVAADFSDNVYVADTLNHRIQRFDSTGSFLTKWGS